MNLNAENRMEWVKKVNFDPLQTRHLIPMDTNGGFALVLMRDHSRVDVINRSSCQAAAMVIVATVREYGRSILLGLDAPLNCWRC